MPTLRPRKRARSSSPSASRASPCDHHGARVRPLQPRHHHQQGRFAGAGRADHSDRLAAPYIEVDVFQDVHPRRPAAEREVDPAERDRRAVAAGWAAVHAVGPPVACVAVPGAGARPLIWGVRAPGPECAGNRGNLRDFAAPAAAQERPLRIVALGDSHHHRGSGCGPMRRCRSGCRLRSRPRALWPRSPMPGVSGDTAANGLARLDWAVPDKTDGVIVALGANDMLRGIDPAVTRKALDDILRRLGERHIPVLLAGMRAAPNFGADFGKSFEIDLSGAGREIRRAALSVLARWRCRRRQAQSGRRYPSHRGRRRPHGRRHPAEGGGTGRPHSPEEPAVIGPIRYCHHSVLCMMTI